MELPEFLVMLNSITPLCLLLLLHAILSKYNYSHFKLFTHVIKLVAQEKLENKDFKTIRCVMDSSLEALTFCNMPVFSLPRTSTNGQGKIP